jgi:diguanylate cyclase (GGDEF)-like protein/PAS domain S-box-containing protein
LLDLLPTGLLLLSLDFRITYSNRAGDAFQARVGEMFLDHIHSDDRALLQMQFGLARLSGPAATGVEIRILTADECEKWTLVSVSPVPQASAERTFMLSLIDIDRRKRSELERRSWEERWNSALVSSTLGVWDHNFKTGVMYYSDTWKQIRGMRPDEDINAATDDWILSVHPEDRDHVLDCILRQSEGELSYSAFEYRERHKDGHWIWIECRGSCIEWDQDGKPTRIVGTDLDVTDRKGTESMLAHVQRRLELALAVTQIGVFEADITEKTVLFDDRLLTILGMDGEPNLQRANDWEHMIHPEDHAKATGRINESVDAEKGFGNQFRIIRKDGSVRHIRASAAPFEDESGHLKYIGANWDVTDDVTIREELERARGLSEARNRELETTKAKIEHNALHDFLTNLPNRRYLDEKLMHRDAGCEQGLAILHLDLDRFKEINDTLGHQAGDSILTHVAKVLRDSVRKGDFVARIGGDEFVIMADFDGHSEALTELAERVISRLRQPVQYKGTTCRIGASIGIAFDADRRVDAKQLLLNSDIALYRAKSRGRNRYEFFSIDAQRQIINAKRVADEILVALERSEFVPYYQLQFVAQSLDIAGVETLARWAHPTKGMLSPDAFLAIAEDLDVVAAIDAMIFEKAHTDFQKWKALGLGVPKFSVNVSTNRLGDPELGVKLATMPISPGTASFELLESIFLDDYDETVTRNLQIMRDMGIGIEIDDFGSGHASIVSLLKIGPGTLKIDRELVMPLTQGPEQRRLVGSIIEIGKSLNIKVVAEGVESRDHIRILQSLGCDVLQGYALARPMPFDGVESFVRQQKWRQG